MVPSRTGDCQARRAARTYVATPHPAPRINSYTFIRKLTMLASTLLVLTLHSRTTGSSPTTPPRSSTANPNPAAVIFDNAGINSVRELTPIIDKLERLVQRVAYMLLAVQFLFFVFVVLVRYSGVGWAASVGNVLGAGLLFFLFAMWCVR